MKHEIRGLLFDLDRTLVDINGCYDDVAEKIFGISAVLGREQYLEFVVGKPFQAWVRALAEATHVPATPELFDEVCWAIEEQLQTACTPTPRILQCLRQYYGEGYKIAVVTNNCEPITMLALSYAQLRPLVHAVICGEDSPYPKPAPHLWLLAVGQLGLLPSECLAMDDSERCLKGPASVGLATWHVSYPQLSTSTLKKTIEQVEGV